MGLLSTLLDCSKTFHKYIDFADSVIRNLPSVIHVQPSKFHFSKLQQLDIHQSAIVILTP